MTPRQEAEALEAFGDDLLKSLKTFCAGFSLATVDRVCAICGDQDEFSPDVEAFEETGKLICSPCFEGVEEDQ